jgi:serine/threonine protein kinase
MIGTTVGGYRVTEQIGMGGMATVFKAYDAATDRYVALKVLPQHYAQDETFIARFQREAKAIAKLEHIHILPIFAYGEDNGITYLVMRYMQTGTLSEKIKKGGAMGFGEASRILTQIAEALDYAHQHKILHRDIKPSNILMDASQNCYLTDFGIAKMTEATLDLTGGGILGTPAYMSPEQCQGGVDLTPASDQYSLGVVLYEMVTGHTPFRAETPLAVIHMQLHDPLPLPRTFRTDLPENVEQVILKGLAKDPANRYENCAALARAFADSIAGLPLDAAPVLAAPTDRTMDVPLPSSPAPIKRPVVKPGGTPGWLWPLIALFGIIVLGGAILGGLALTNPGLAASILPPTATPTDQPTATPTEIPLTILTSGVGIRIIACFWQNLGAGLCINPEGHVIKILQDTDLRFQESLSVAWSPDGSQIVFATLAPGEPGDRETDIYIVNADGSDLHELPNDQNNTNATWSPDSQWIAFHSSGKLAMIRPDGTDYTVLADSQAIGCAMSPQWAPDSQRIVVLGMDGCTDVNGTGTKVMILSLDGGPAQIVASDVLEKNCPTWPDVAFGPDGKDVVYTNSQCQIILAAADGSGVTGRLATFPFWWQGNFTPQWGTH